MTRVRDTFVKSKALKFYSILNPELMSLPFDIIGASSQFSDIKILTYKEFAAMHDIVESDIATYAESKDGVTYYSKEFNKYIILYNDTAREGRMRFTVAHEFGHIFLSHLTDTTCKAASNSPFEITDTTIEQEADRFASTILCPFPVLNKLNVESSQQIRKICNVSTQAAKIGFEQYTEWNKYHKKTAWENDVLKLFEPFLNEPPVWEPHRFRNTFL